MTQLDTSPPAAEPLLAYASGIHPPAEKSSTDPALFTRQGESLVAFHGSTLPARCVLCGNDGSHEPIKLTFTWDSSFTMTSVSTLQLRQQAYVHAYLCALHRARWSSGRLIGGMGVAAAIALMLGGSTLAVISESSAMPSNTPLGIALTIAGFALMICFLFFFTLRSRTLTCRKIEEGYLYLEGASPGFLAHLESPAMNN